METSELIKQVKLRPAIWNSARRDDKKMAAAWRHICTIAWPDFNSRSVDEKRSKCLELQKKWKDLQQSFVRDHLRQKQGKERGVQRGQYYDQLSFLAPTIESKRTPNASSNVSTSETVTMTPTPSTPSSSASANSDAEEDRQFLLSLVSFMQDVPRSRKLALRSEILQVISRYSGGESISYKVPPMSQEY